LVKGVDDGEGRRTIFPINSSQLRREEKKKKKKKKKK
jgi:hypothetical protein